MLPVDRWASWSLDREIGMAWELAREGERRFVLIGEAQAVQGVGDDDLGFRSNEVIASASPMNVVGVEDCPVAERERISGAEEAR
jgi:hypothetical protein